MANIYRDYFNSTFGIHLGFNGERTIRRRDNGNVILNFTGINTFNLYGSRFSDVLDGRVIGGSPNILFGNNGNDTIYGKAGDWLDGGSGNDAIYATAAGYINGGTGNDTLFADYSQLDYGGKGIDFGVLTPRGAYTVLRLDTNASLYTGASNVGYGFESMENIQVVGTVYDDILRAVGTTNNLSGGGGNDTFIGEKGSFSGGAGTDTLIANYSNNYVYPYGIRFTASADNNFAGSVTQVNNSNNILLSFDGIESLNVTGTQYNDVFIGGNGDDTFDGLRGDDSLEGGAGSDKLFAKNGSDTLRGGLGDDYLYAVADIEGKVKQLYGNEGADTFVLDLKGSIGLGFNFNTQTLANFVNAITLPEDEGYDWGRMGIDLGFGVLGAVAGAIPGVGGAAGFLTSVLQMGVDGYLGQNEIQQQIQAQEARASAAVQQYSSANWGSVSTTGARDTIYVNDFQIGIDTIVLPKLTDATNFYTIGAASSFQGKGGAFIQILGNGGVEQARNVAFIANNYTDIGLTDGAFRDLIADLLQGTVISTFTKTPILGVNQTSGVEIKEGSFARDVIRGDGGNDELFGHYGDDAIFGDAGNDTLHGGSNNSLYRSQYEAIYGNDGNDFLDGGAGNDSLNGGTGNDWLNGGIGNDTLNGGTGNDTLNGGDGNDSLIAGTGINTVDGGAGTDTLIVDYSQSSYYAVHLGWLGQNAIFGRNNEGVVLSFNNVERFQITGTSYDDVFEGRSGNDTFRGGDGNDYLSGAAGNDSLVGGNGNDNLLGGTGVDTLTGGAGNDLLTGGTGNDLLTGGTNADRFIFNSLTEGVDTITDFSVAQGDKIQISLSGFGATSSSQFSFNATTRALSFNNQQFATLQGSTTFNVATDIVLV
jgi:Ca2+-binding RTX toxin-like protein